MDVAAAFQLLQQEERSVCMERMSAPHCGVLARELASLPLNVHYDEHVMSMAVKLIPMDSAD